MIRVFLIGGPVDGLEYDYPATKTEPPTEIYVAQFHRAEFVWVYRQGKQLSPIGWRFGCKGWVKASDVPASAKVLIAGANTA